MMSTAEQNSGVTTGGKRYAWCPIYKGVESVFYSVNIIRTEDQRDVNTGVSSR